MTDEPENLTLRYLCRIDDRLARLEDMVSDLGTDMRGVKAHLVGFHQSELAQDGAIASIRERLSRVERRLDLSEPAP